MNSKSISEEKRKAISKYTIGDIKKENFSHYPKREDLGYVILYHPCPIVRHEASFVASQLLAHEFIPYLMIAARADPSTVARHEAIEALGDIKSLDKEGIRKFLKKIQASKGYARQIDYIDIKATVKSALESLDKEALTRR